MQRMGGQRIGGGGESLAAAGDGVRRELGDR